MKQHIQGMVIGVLIAALLLPGLSALAKIGTESLSVMYRDIKLIVNGKEATITGLDGNVVEPFAYNGRTFVPIAAVGEALGLPLEWDGDTNTAYVGTKPGVAGATVKLSKLDYFAKDGRDFDYKDQVRANTGDYFSDCFIRELSWLYGGGIRDYLVNRQYKKISGTVFVDYNSRGMRGIGEFSIWGDGKLLYSSDEVKDGFMPTYFEVDISNITTLRVGFGRMTGETVIMGISDVTLHK